MAFSLIGNVAASASGSQNVTTGSLDTTGADLIVISVATYHLGGGPTVTDSKGNTWTPLTNYGISFATTERLYYCLNPTVGSGHTFTVSTSLDYPTICVAAWSGVKATSPFDVENGNSNTSSSTIATGSVAPGEDNELIVTGLCFGSTSTASIDSSFSITDQKQYNSAVNMGGALAYKIQTTAASVNPTWTITGSPFQLATAIATFKAAAADDNSSSSSTSSLSSSSSSSTSTLSSSSTSTLSSSSTSTLSSSSSSSSSSTSTLSSSSTSSLSSNSSSSTSTLSSSSSSSSTSSVLCPLLASLKAYWPLDEVSDGSGAVTRVDARGHCDLTDNNTTPSATGKLGNAANFTAANSEYLSIPSKTDLQITDVDGNFTIQAWVNLTSKSSNRTIVSKWFTSGLEYRLRYNSSLDRFEFSVGVGTGSTDIAADALGSPSTGTWYLIHGWHNGTADEIGIAVNAGTANATAETNANHSATNPFEIGRSHLDGDYFDGQIDEVGFWKRVLTSAERSELYNSGNGLAFIDFCEENSSSSSSTSISSLSSLSSSSTSTLSSSSTSTLSSSSTSTLSSSSSSSSTSTLSSSSTSTLSSSSTSTLSSSSSTSTLSSSSTSTLSSSSSSSTSTLSSSSTSTLSSSSSISSQSDASSSSSSTLSSSSTSSLSSESSASTLSSSSTSSLSTLSSSSTSSISSASTLSSSSTSTLSSASSLSSSSTSSLSSLSSESTLSSSSSSSLSSESSSASTLSSSSISSVSSQSDESSSSTSTSSYSSSSSSVGLFPASAGVEGTGLYSTGVIPIGLGATGVTLTGIRGTGVESTGQRSTGVQKTGLNSTGTKRRSSSR